MGDVVKLPVQRWPASRDPELSPVEFLEALCADIRKGRYSPQALLLTFVQINPKTGMPLDPPPYIAVNLSPLEAAGLAAKLAKVLT